MSKSEIQFPVIKVSQGLGDFFIGNISARNLVNISYVDVRRIYDERREVEMYLGIQRPLDTSRVKKIKEYIQAPDAVFPTGVVIAVNQNSAEFDQNGQLTLSAFESEFEEDNISQGRIAKVLDGQHRIAAFCNENGSVDESLGDLLDTFQFNVVVFIGLDVDEQANIFATVNLAQTKVNKSLVYDLEGLSRTRSPFRTCHQIAVALDSADESSPLFHRIKRLGVKTKGRMNSEPLTQAVFVESLIKLISPDPFKDRTIYMKGKRPEISSLSESNKYPLRVLFLQERDSDIAIIIYNYFSCIRDTWPKAWSDVVKEGNILPKSNAFKAFMRFLRDIYPSVLMQSKEQIPSSSDFAPVFKSLNVLDSEFTSGNFLPGSGGEAAFYRLLKGEVTIQDLKA